MAASRAVGRQLPLAFPSLRLPASHLPPRKLPKEALGLHSAFHIRCRASLRPLSSSASAAGGDGLPSPAPELMLYNTERRRKEAFRPLVEGKVGMYVCGVTPYDYSHIGHARAYVAFDVLFRYLKYLKYDVFYVRNFTDIDDKIIARANSVGEDPLKLSNHYSEEFLHDMSCLQCLPPSVEPRVSGHIDQIISMIKKIIDNGYAYIIDGDVYYSVDKYPDYGKLSHRTIKDNRAGERVAVDERKRNPADFALWKAAKDGEPSWNSPWGFGRPGWHIECSAMSAEYLGYSFDIHGGGEDLIFPHHENEIAQSRAACHHSSVNYWLHNGFVTINGQKMSKSLGNFVTIREVIELYHPLALRLFLLSTHYRSPINYTREQLDVASDRLYYIYQTLLHCEEFREQHESSTQNRVPTDTADCLKKFDRDFDVAMSDDLHTSVVLSAIADPLRVINDLLHTRKGKKQQGRAESLFSLELRVRSVLSVLGLLSPSCNEVLQKLREKALARAGISEDEVLRKIEERSSAREAKQYQRSDEIRLELAALGIALMDNPEGTTWRPVLPIQSQEQAVHT